MARLRIPRRFDADVVIAGGGPAGASAAARLAASGVKVIVLDQRSFPRDKVCGDFVGPAALIELEALGITERVDYGASNIIRSAALYLDGRELIRRPLPEVEPLPSYGRCIPRLVLDAWVLDAARGAGAQIDEGARVTGFDVQPNAVVVTAQRAGEPFQLTARLLIGADGSSSVVARQLRGAAQPDEDRIIAVRAYYRGVTGPDDRADLFFSANSFPGYYWLFPTGPGEANVGVGMVLETLPPTDDHLRALLADLVASDPALAGRLTNASLEGKVVGWPLNTYDPRLTLHSDRVLLIGDAAGFINPLNGEGIQYALLSGRWAADTAIDCFASDDCSAESLAPYAARAARELRYDMALAGLIVEFIRNRHLNRVWLELLQAITSRARVDDEYAHICGGILAGLSPARDALSLKVVGRTIDQALYSTFLAVAWTALKGPAHLASRGLGITQEAAAVTKTLLADPVALTQWLIGVVRHGAELALQFGMHLGEHTSMEPVPALPTARPARVRLPIPS